MAIKTQHIICILGNWQNFSTIEALLAANYTGFTLDKDYSELESDDRMLTAFEASNDRPMFTLNDDDREAISSHSAVAYLLSPEYGAANAEAVSGQALSLIAALLNAGGVAAKSECAGLAHGKARWIQLAYDYQSAIAKNDAFSAGAALYQAWVLPALSDDDGNIIYSIGMHLLGQRDTEFIGVSDAAEAIKWIDLMGYYLLADKPERPIINGEGFRLVENGPRCQIQQRPCDRYEEDDLFYNPYGYNSMLPE